MHGARRRVVLLLSPSSAGRDEHESTHDRADEASNGTTAAQVTCRYELVLQTSREI